MTPELTVVVPARDAAATLGITLAGLVGHPDVARVIVVDDGSVDDTAAIARGAGVTVVGGDGSGPAAARNRGVEAVTTTLVAFCDADDEWIAPVPDPRLAALADDPALDGAWGTTICRRDEPGAIDEAPTHLGALHGLVVRTEAFRRVGPFEESMRLGEDVDWILRARRAGLRIAMLDVPCARYRLRSDGLSGGPGAKAAGLLAAVRRAAEASAARPEREAEPGSAVASVAVVVPAADGARYLREALASIRAQDPAPAVVVVGDDASTDDTVAVARAAGVVVVSSTERQGPNAARMAALEAADLAAADLGGGSAAPELVAFCDADDVWPAGRLATMVAALEGDPDAAGVVGRVASFASPDRDTSGLEVPSGSQPGVVIGALLVRRADLDAVGGLRTDLIGGELVALERALAARGRPVLRIDDVVLRRRIHGDNLTIQRADEVRRAYLTLAIEGTRARP